MWSFQEERKKLGREGKNTRVGGERKEGPITQPHSQQQSGSECKIIEVRRRKGPEAKDQQDYLC